MPWPKDPQKRAEALAKHRAAQQKRWSSPEERARASERAKAQYADPAARRALSEGVRQTWTPERRAAHRDACRESLPPAPVIDVDPDKLGVTRAPVLRGELALLRELHGCIAMREDVLTSEVRDLLEQLENRRVHCYQTSITLRGRPAKGYGETLCGMIVEDWFGTAKQMGLVGPFDALDHPECVTCEACAVLLPALRTQILAKARRVYAESGKQQPAKPRLGSGVVLRLELIALAAKKRGGK